MNKIVKKNVKLLTYIQSFLVGLNTFLLTGQITSFAVVSTSSSFGSKFIALLREYRTIANAALGLLLFLSMLTFIYHCVKLVQSADNPQQRSEAIHNLLICGVCLAIQGSISLFIMLYFYLFN